MASLSSSAPERPVPPTRRMDDDHDHAHADDDHQPDAAMERSLPAATEEPLTGRLKSSRRVPLFFSFAASP